MLQFVCDWCGRLKEAGQEGWIVGVAAESVAPTAARREIAVHAGWNRDEAVGRFAVHFCCQDCKDRYIAAMFDKPAEMVDIRTVKRRAPRTAVKETVEKRTVRRRKSA